MATRKRLTRDDWVRAGYRALAANGPAAVAIEPIAASLGATKGSGYWHFRSRAELLDAVLQHYAALHTEAVITAVDEQRLPPRQRLEALIRIVSDTGGDEPNEALTVLALDQQTAPRIRAVHERRTEYVAAILREAGVGRAEALRRAELAYAAVLGLHTLAPARRTPLTPAARRRLGRTLVDILLPAD
jgi:AcrR family transcriptional regulator